ncbi:MAG: hypothetical protein WC602_04365 [archaeon]
MKYLISTTLIVTLLCLFSPTFAHSSWHHDYCCHTNPTCAFDCTRNKVPQESWLYSNSGNIVGALLGSFLAGIVALVSILLAHKKNKEIQDISLKNERIQREDIYCGNLFAIYHEINWHKNLSKRLTRELKIIKQQSIDTLSFPCDQANELFRIEYLDRCRINVLEYARFDTDLLTLISTYLNLIMTINNSLNFTVVSKMKNKFDSDVRYKEALSGYFKILENIISDANRGMGNIQSRIVEVVGSFPGNQLIFKKKQNTRKVSEPHQSADQAKIR